MIIKDIILKERLLTLIYRLMPSPKKSPAYSKSLIHSDYGIVIVSVDGHKIDITLFRDDAPEKT